MPTVVNREVLKFLDGEYSQPWSPWNHSLEAYYTDDDYLFPEDDEIDWTDQ